MSSRSPESHPAATASDRLSFAQERLWFLDRFDTGTAVYNVPLVFDIEGRADAKALQQSFTDLIARHAALRRLFTAPGAALDCAKPVAMPWRTAAAASEAEAAKLVEDFIREPFDLMQQTPIRALHVERSENLSTLALVAHHIAVDGVTMEIVQRELFELYAARVEGREPRLQPLEVQYPDFARWQREWLSGDRLESRLSYWRNRLDGVDDSSPLPTDFRRPPRRRNRGATETIELPGPLQDRVRRAGESAGGSPYMVFLAAFFVLLYRYSGREDLCVGTLLANRSRLPRQWRRAVSGMAGFFANTLALRQSIGPNWSFEQVLRAVQATAMGAFAHQDLPFEKLVEAIDPPRDLSKNPLFQLTFAMQEAPPRSFDVGVRVWRRDVHTGASRSDLMLTIDVAGPEARAIAEYDTDLFRAETIRRLLRHYLRLTEVLVAKPRVPIAHVDYLDDTERRYLTIGVNPAPTADPGRCIHHLFEHHARRRPGAVAVRCNGVACTYGELNAQANRVARLLLAAGVGPEDRVGLHGQRNTNLVAALFGVLKAGAAYVPLDPDYPEERLHYIAADAKLSSILIDSQESGPSARFEVPAIRIDDDDGGDSNPAVTVDPSNLAYVLYTSGSTGEPKGVAVEHRNVAALVDWARQTFSASDLERVLCATSFSFDVSVFELFAPLLCGGSVELVENLLTLANPEESHEPTLVSGVPSAFDKLLRSGSMPASARVVVSAGERLSQGLADRIYGAHPGIRVFDCYGPTEDTVYATYALRKAGGPETIGTPLPHGRAYVLDTNRQLLPIGAPGELYLGGRRLARGYWNQRQLTSEKFLPDPFLPGERMYQTGDRARRLAEGSLEFLGRGDGQLKIRGFRIEPGEIETALLRLPGVDEACALVRQTPEGPLLAAYVVLEGGQAPSTGERTMGLKRALALKLPAHAVPNLIAILPALPRLPNGKIDRGALPAPFGDYANTPMHEPPDGETETMLAGAFAKVLNVAGVGRNDNFFDLGGHSLLAFALVNEIERRSGLEFPLAAPFQYPTPRVFAVYLEQSRREIEQAGGQLTESAQPMRSGVTIRASGDKPPIFVVPDIGGNVVGLAQLARALASGQPIYGLGVPEQARTTIEEIAAEYMAVLRARTEGPFVLLGICWGAVVAFEMAQRFSVGRAPLTLLALLDPLPIGGVDALRGPLGFGLLRRALSALGMSRRESTLEASQRLATQANREAARRYRPGEYHGQTAIFLTDGRDNGGDADPRLAWSHLARSAPNIIRAPGRNSDDALAQPNVEHFARSLAEQVEQAVYKSRTVDGQRS